jgi:hypothetical protein
MLVGTGHHHLDQQSLGFGKFSCLSSSCFLLCVGSLLTVSECFVVIRVSSIGSVPTPCLCQYFVTIFETQDHKSTSIYRGGLSKVV